MIVKRGKTGKVIGTPQERIAKLSAKIVCVKCGESFAVTTAGQFRTRLCEHCQEEQTGVDKEE